MSRKILFVEDEPTLLSVYKKVFAAEGFEVQTALNGEEGLSALQTFVPDLILLDIMMPKVNGFEFLARIKAKPECKQIPVVILTNLSALETEQTAEELGAIRYIRKGEHRPSEVVKTIERILNGDARKAESVRKNPSPKI